MVINYTKWFGVVDSGIAWIFDALTFGALPDRIIPNEMQLGPVAQRQSGRLITVWSKVRILPGPLLDRLRRRFFSLLLMR